MSNIQLKKIITDHDGLIIKNGKVSITDITPSLNFYSGSIVTNGGIGIQCTENAINSKKGGGLSIAGGIGILKDAYIGGNLEIDSNAGVLKIAGVSTERLLLDTITNKNFHISLDGIRKQFELSGDSLYINSEYTFISGGVNIESPNEIGLALNSSAKINKNLYIGENIFTDGKIMFSENVIIEKEKTSDTLFISSPEIMYFGDVISYSFGSINLNNVIKINNDNVSIDKYTEFQNNVLLKDNVIINGALTINKAVEVKNDLYISGDILKIPVGKSQERYGVEGSIRFNNDNQQFQGYTGKIWQTFGGVIDTDYDTTIIAEKYQGVDDDSLRFITDGIERMIISSSGNIGIGTESPISKFTIYSKVPTNTTTGEICISTDTYSTFMGIQKDKGFYISTQNDQIRFIIKGQENLRIQENSVHIGIPFYLDNKIHINSTQIESNNDELIVNQNKISFSKDNQKYFQLDGVTNKHLLNGDLELTGKVHVSQIQLLNDFQISPFLSGLGLLINYKNTSLLEIDVEDNITKIKTENTNINGDVEIIKSLKVHKNLIIENDTEISGDIRNGGDIYSGRNVFVKEKLETNSIKANEDITANGKIFVKGNLTSETGESYMDKLKINSLNVNEKFSVDDQLDINVKSNFNKVVFMEEYLGLNEIQLGKNFVIREKDIGHLEIKSNEELVLEIEHTSGNVNIKNNVSLDNLDVKKDINVSNDISIKGNLKIYSTTPSSSINEGSFVVNGGMGVGENLNVGGDVIVNGSLTVVGEMTTIDSKNISINDNTFFLNSAPSGSSDSGIFITRYQNENDTGAGDVVNDNDYITFKLNMLEQNSIGLDEVKLPETASEVDNYYVNYWIRCISGFSANQVRRITSYNGKSKIAKISQPWTGQNPTDLVNLYKKSHVGLVYNEIDDIFQLVGIHQERTNDYTSQIGLKCDSIITKKSTYITTDAKIQETQENMEKNGILDKISNLRSIKYKNKGDKKYQLGIVPDDLEMVFPELVERGEYNSIDYARLSVILLECVKELKRIVERNN